MKAADLSTHPHFDLMKQSDIVSFYHLQMPRWLYVHSKYKTISLEAKVAYTFLLNRFQLSKMNNWVNSDNEVFVIFTRESLADEMGISYRKAIACFKELVAVDLIWEQRLGRGHANQIYLASVELSEEDASKDNTAPFTRPAEMAHQENQGNSDDNEGKSIFLPNQEVPKSQIKTCKNGTSSSAENVGLDLQYLHTSNYTIPKGMDTNRNAIQPEDFQSILIRNIKTYATYPREWTKQKCNPTKIHMSRQVRDVKIHKYGQLKNAKIPIDGRLENRFFMGRTY